jgi:ribonuclease T2
MYKKILGTFSLIIGLSCQLPVLASEKLEGTFTLTKSCKAYSSIRKQSNPIDLKIGQQYRVVAKNKPSPSHYRIVVSDSRSQNNWVAVGCGELNGQAAPATAVERSSSKDYLLALSWQPGFCLTHGSKKECKSGNSRSYSASHLSLHGLWPQPRNNAYCGVSETDRSIDRKGRWDLLKPLTLSSGTKKELNKVMPGFVSLLQRHEWIKHGTCYSKTAEQYYVDSIHLTNQINLTSLDEMITKNKGKKVTLSAIRKNIAESLGKDAASRVAVRCGLNNLITDLWIGLSGDIQKTPLNKLMAQGDAPQSNCKSGLVAKY